MLGGLGAGTDLVDATSRSRELGEHALGGTRAGGLALLGPARFDAQWCPYFRSRADHAILIRSQIVAALTSKPADIRVGAKMRRDAA